MSQSQIINGEIDRQCQQQVIEAAAKQAKNINSITEFENILETVSKNIETNMSLEQIISFYSVGKDMLMNSNSSTLSIKKTYLSYYNLNVWLKGPGRYTSALGYWPGSLEAIKTLMKENLGLETPKPIKTFSISYNEDYSTPLVGRGIATGEKLQLAKNFVGASQYEASTWCESVGVTCTFETTTNYQTAGLIVEQSVHKGELLKTISNITFYISDGLGTPPVSEIPPTDEELETPEEGTGDSNSGTETPPEENTDIGTENTTPNTETTTE